MIVLIIGRRLMGKTTLGRYVSLKSSERVTIDPRGMLPRDGAIVATSPAEAEAAITSQAREVVIIPKRSVQPTYEHAIESVARRVERYNPRSLTVMIDELRFVPNPITPALDWLMRCSDPSCVNVVFTCHRPVDVPTDIRAIADHWFLFRMTLEHDLKVIGERSDRAASIVAKLPERHFVAWDDAKGELTVHTDPKRWLVPLRSIERARGLSIENDALIDEGVAVPEREDGLF